MAQSKTEMLGTIILDAVNTLAQMPDGLFERPLVCKIIIINPEFSVIVDRKIAEAQAEAVELVKAKGDVMYAPNDKTSIHEILKAAITDLGIVPQEVQDAAAAVTAQLTADEVAAVEAPQSNG